MGRKNTVCRGTTSPAVGCSAGTNRALARCNCKYQIENCKLKICHTAQPKTKNQIPNTIVYIVGGNSFILYLLFTLSVLTFAFCALHFLQMTLLTRISTGKNSSQSTGILLFSPIYYLLMFGGNRQRESLHNALRYKKIRFSAGGMYPE